ncbi:CocE/NonD family hydrolase [Microbacterium sp. Au-Mic1]|uniref:CocE/NonD family hydrolase n=1 Tax=Microbacterium sp. Au-Mic1 TaxID=2906457 RepID=UPI001E434EC7|nr:CocE/NonD family hydrolase [Microbacterium sp. Au-Mic1]MCE4025669.1 CocE/NonD family hydrolase [Microbacterium sp. Au-Mic1]
MSRGDRLPWTARAEYRRLRSAPDMPAPTHPVVHRTSGIAVPADDGATLLTDHWAADDAGPHTVLIRTPYDRNGVAAVARFLAERGHHVVVQSCRGTFGSGGRFRPLHDEVADGQATLRWLRAQPWATGLVHSWGGSYFGVTQWAYCDGELRPDAMGIAVSARRFDEAILYLGHGFSIDTPLAWAYALGVQERRPPARLWRLLRARRGLTRGARTVPPSEAVPAALGNDPQFFRDWVEHSDPGDPWWDPLHFASDPAAIPPVTLLAGWQDLFLVGQLHDHAALQGAGVRTRLIVGDWIHGAAEITVIGVREALRVFEGESEAAAVRVEISGGGGWRDLTAWPPPSVPHRLELTADGRLAAPGIAHDSGALASRYDPADPTPDAGGRTLNPFSAGRRDQRRRERRDDVLLFTGEPLAGPLLVMGSPEMRLTFASTNPRADVFVRLCEVDRRGVSRTVTDGYLRLSPPVAPGEPRDVGVVLAPVAHRFAAGNRLRVQVSWGAHPLHLRNPGTADPVRDHSRLIASIQTLFLGGTTPAMLVLPLSDDTAPSVHPTVPR